MLNNYMKKSVLPWEQTENKVSYIKKLGFYDIDAEYVESNLNEEKEIKMIPVKIEVQPIHEDIIREVDEGPPDNSVIKIYENNYIPEIEFDNLKKPFTTLSTSKKIQGNAAIKKKKNQKVKNFNSINLQDENKKLCLSGMLRLKNLSQNELKSVFNQADIDEFTETFFKQNPPILDEQEKIKVEKEKNIPEEPYFKFPSAMLVLDDSFDKIGSIDNTPINKPQKKEPIIDQDNTPLENLRDVPFKSISVLYEKKPSWISEDEGKKEDEELKRQKTTKEDNTNVAITSPSSTINDGIKLHKIKTLNNKQTEEENKNSTPFGINDKNALLQIADEKKADPKAIPSQETPGETPDSIFEEKFIIKMGDISVESTIDVMPRKMVVQDIPEIKISTVQIIPPYKIKAIIIPTEWPLERPIEENETNKSENHSVENVASTAGNKEEICSASAGSKISNRSRKSKKRTTQRRPKPKSKKSKKAINDVASKASGSLKKEKNKAPPSIIEPKKNEVTQGNIDTYSKLESASRKDGNGPQEEEKKTNENNHGLGHDENNNLEDVIKSKPEQPWSGQEVLKDADPYGAVWLTTQLSETRIWAHGWKGIWAHIRWHIRQFVNSTLCENFMNLLVIINTVTLAMDRYNQPSSEKDIMDMLNYIFTSIFTAELILKLIGLGIVRYLSDSLNYLDGLVVLFSWVEIIFLGGGGAISAFRTLRVFRLVRTVRVLRVARLLRGLQSMMTLLDVISNTIGSFGYIGLMLLIIMLIYSLFGIKLFAGRWNYPDGLPRPNFDSFNNAFIAVFQLLTVENWPTLLYSGLRNQFQPLVAIYYISFLLIGNYILLNMFLAIMLDSFVEVSANQEDDEEDEVIFIF